MGLVLHLENNFVFRYVILIVTNILVIGKQKPPKSKIDYNYYYHILLSKCM